MKCTAAGICLTLMTLAVVPVRADVAPRWTDQQLAGLSDVIVRARVLGIGVARDARLGVPCTLVTLVVSEVVRGPVPFGDGPLVLKQLGGRIGTTALDVAGQPTFTVGEDVVLFLEIRPRDRTLTTTGQWQGKFSVLAGDGAEGIAVHRDPQRADRGVFGADVRSLVPWLAELRRAGQRMTEAGADRIASVPVEAGRAVPTSGTSGRAAGARWRETELARGAVRVDTVSPGQPTLPDRGERALRDAAGFWTDAGLVAFAPGGLQAAGCAMAREPDGRVAVGTDACGELSPRGGTIAMSATWLRDESDQASAIGSRILGAFVITNSGPAASTLLASSSCFQQLAAHELGHTFGLGHSGDGAMAPFLECGGFGSVGTAPAASRDQIATSPLALTPSVSQPGTSSVASTASGAAGLVTTRISLSTDGAQANGSSRSPSISADGRYVAFASSATNLLAGDSNGKDDIFVFDRSTRILTRESVASDGSQSDGDSSRPLLSADGRYLAFLSAATTLVPGVSGSQAYVRDRVTGRVGWASVPPPGFGLSSLSDHALSGNGRYLAFAGRQTGRSSDSVFVRDLQNGATTTEADVGGAPALSADGRVLMYDGVIDTFFPVLYTKDRATGQVVRETDETDFGLCYNNSFASLSADGRYAAFFSRPGNTHAICAFDRIARQHFTIASHDVLSEGPYSLLPPVLAPSARFLVYAYANERREPPQVYRVDQALSRLPVSVGPDGSLGNGPSGTAFPSTGYAVSSDGIVAFQSDASNLIAGDTNSATDIFVVSNLEPGAPGTLTYSLSGSSVTLTWTTPVTGATVTGYVVEAGSTSGTSDLTSFPTSSTATTFTATGVASGTYYVRVRSVAGGVVGPSSNEVAVVVSGCTGPPPAPALAASVSGSTVTLSWSAAAGATTYLLAVGSGPRQSDILVTDLGSPATTLTATNVAPRTYFVRLLASNVCGTSAPSNEAAVIVPSS